MTARTLGIAAITMVALLGCGREPEDGALDKGEGTAAPLAAQAAPASPGSAAAAAPAPLVEDAFAALPGGQLEFRPPFGWLKQVRGAWIAYESPDRLAVMAFTPVGEGEKV